jgi:hypothetical protein
MLFLVWNYSYQRGSWLLGPESDVPHFSVTSVTIHQATGRPIRRESSVFVVTRFRLAVMWWRNERRTTPPTAQNVSNGPPSRPWRAHMTSQQGSRHFLTSNHYICFTDVRHLIFHALFPCDSPTNYLQTSLPDTSPIIKIWHDFPYLVRWTFSEYLTS